MNIAYSSNSTHSCIWNPASALLKRSYFGHRTLKMGTMSPFQWQFVAATPTINQLLSCTSAKCQVHERKVDALDLYVLNYSL